MRIKSVSGEILKCHIRHLPDSMAHNTGQENFDVVTMILLEIDSKREIFHRRETGWLEIHRWCTLGLARSVHQLEFPRLPSSLTDLLLHKIQKSTKYKKKHKIHKSTKYKQVQNTKKHKTEKTIQNYQQEKIQTTLSIHWSSIALHFCTFYRLEYSHSQKCI